MRIAFATAAPPSSQTHQSSPELRIAAPRIGGSRFETIPPSAGAANAAGKGKWTYDSGMTLYATQLRVEAETICDTAHAYFRSIFSDLAGKALYRIWTYVPDINQGEGDDEVYRRFCLGRSRAFEEFFSEQSERYMAAGSCVGCSGNVMTILALSGSEQPAHFENPNQLPAYRYPREYGPKAPSFARASKVQLGNTRYRFISGTAAVLGHESIGVGNLQRQLEVTGDNLETIVAETETDPQRCSTTAVAGKVYLRHERDFESARRYMEERFPDWSRDLIYLHSDICRKELLIEVELTFTDSLEP